MSVRVAIVCDLLEEDWPSMSLVGDMLAAHLPGAAPDVEAVPLRPPMHRRAMRLPLAGRSPVAYAVDRYANRYLDYPWWLRRRQSGFDVFHVIDHSYAHLVHGLPPARTIVTCHDIDAFRCLLPPASSRVYRGIAGRILGGLRKAAAVTCDTRATRDDLVSHGLLPASRLSIVPNGVHPALLSGRDASAAEEVSRLLGPMRGPELLHVGSTIPRKRIDLLLEVFCLVRSQSPHLRLVRVGGPLTPRQRAQAVGLGVADAIVELPFLRPDVLAAVYRRAALTVLPSEAEGFGLPVIESMASGTVVLASRIPALVETGGDAALYCPPGDAGAWSRRILELLAERHADQGAWSARQERGRRRAAGFTWFDYARKMGDLYARVAAGVLERSPV
jgi:glycosyltransferase involved in cell wall biosynthesis